MFPTEITTYTLVATNDVGERRRTVTVEVDDEVDGNGPVIVSFAPTMSLVNPGLPQTLTWNVVGADTLTLFGPGIEGGTVVTGTSTFGPTIDLPPNASFTTVRITLGQSVPGAVEVRYMPPAGALASVAVDVIRSATCTEPMPGLGVCLPMPAFGMGTDAVTSARLSTLRFDDTE